METQELKIGQKVRYWRGVKEGKPSGAGEIRNIGRLGHGEDVVWIKGCVGCIALTHIEVVPEGKFATELDAVIFDVHLEIDAATRNWPLFNSAHEGYAVLAEEVDELWNHVKTNQKRRDLHAMRKEAIQVAAVAIRFAHEVCDEERGRK